jgi:hypothetical protein
LDAALKYMEIFYSGEDLDRLYLLFDLSVLEAGHQRSYGAIV